MSIASEIQKLIQNLASAYTACNAKGATLPSDENFDNLSSTIATIQTGGSTTLITKTITQNGTYNAYDDNADGYSQVTVNVQLDRIPIEYYQAFGYIEDLQTIYENCNNVVNINEKSNGCTLRFEFDNAMKVNRANTEITIT